ncbi:MAG: glutamate decarboxylase [bacterium]|nr:MAG: glutamate decarboxylase [bacterium]
MLSKKKNTNEKETVSTTYASRFFTKPVSRYLIPDEGMDADVVYQLIHDELNIDGNPALNLASFVTTWMEPQAEKLIMETLNKNLVDQDEYPQTGIIQERVINMLAQLFHAPENKEYIGTATIGSSEAIMLGLLAHKWHWRKKRKQQGKSTQNPNMVIGADVHVVWEKFARYFDVEMRVIPMQKNRFTITAEEVKQQIDENTICVGAVMGTTFTGQLDPVQEINTMLEEVENEKGWHIPIHVDGASGGFILPFLYPDFKWDFRLSHVRSINVSGHKYGLVYPGIGWLIMKDKSELPEELIFYVNYLGSEEATYTLNFSRGSAMVAAQYYNLLRLGRNGYRQIMENSLTNAQYLASKINEIKTFDLINKDIKLPILALTVTKSAGFNVYQLSDKLRERGWIVPAYSLPADADDIKVLRIVIKENFSRDMADMLIQDMLRFSKELTGEKKPKPESSCRNQVHKNIC